LEQLLQLDNAHITALTTACRPHLPGSFRNLWRESRHAFAALQFQLLAYHQFSHTSAQLSPFVQVFSGNTNIANPNPKKANAKRNPHCTVKVSFCRFGRFSAICEAQGWSENTYEIW